MVSGKIIRAGRIDVDGEPLTGIFIEMSGKEIMEISRKNLYNRRVYVAVERRKKEREK